MSKITNSYRSLSQAYSTILEQQQTNVRPGINPNSVSDIINDIKVDRIVADLNNKQNTNIQQQDSESPEHQSRMLELADQLEGIARQIRQEYQ